MENLIELREYPLEIILKYLLMDKTTKKNIIFATDIYSLKYPDITTMAFQKAQSLLG